MTAKTFVGLLLFVSASLLRAQVPELISYQGSVAVGAVNFNGTGFFKFALVNATGSTTHWSNDGTSVAGSEPTAAVPLPVSNGLYSVLLGDSALANMMPIPASVFANAGNTDVRLRVWFNDGTNGSQLLTPDQRIAAVGYAMMAAHVPDASITSAKLAANAVTAANIAPGTITSAQLASGAAAANLNATGQSGVASGGMVLSATDNNTALVSAGYVRIGTVATADLWQQRINGTPPAARGVHTAVWTGSEMIIWGGQLGSGASLNTGGRFNPAGNTWTAVSATGAPGARGLHTVVWTGSEMIVWGGINGNPISAGSYLNTGGRYTPVSNTWTVMSTAGAPAGRNQHTAVWTGSEMIVWGGFNASTGYLNNGGRYTPVSNTWTAVTAVSAPTVRSRHTAVWTGGEMLVWGGYDGGSHLNDGGRYAPGGTSWTPVTATNAPTAREQHTAVWTGSEMIVWGGYNGSSYLNDGGRYTPAGDTWTAVAATVTPGVRSLHTAAWTGSEMIVWGGYNGSSYLNDGGRYTPAGNTWTAVTTTGAPAGRNQHTAVWTGSEMIVWGGTNGGYLNDTFSYMPGRVMFLYQRP